MVEVQGSTGAFAAIKTDRTVIAWGSRMFGGIANAVQDQLRTLEIRGPEKEGLKFETRLQDTTRFQDTTRYYKRVGTCTNTKKVLVFVSRNVKKLQASERAFAALLEDGSVLTWGDPDFGGDSSAVRDQLKGVQDIQASERAFAAIRKDGSVATWGARSYGGDCSAVRDRLRHVKEIQSNERAFAAIRLDGEIVAWGSAAFGGSSYALGGA